MRYFRHPPLLGGVLLLFAFVAVYFLGSVNSGELVTSVSMANIGKVYSSELYDTAHQLESLQVEGNLTEWCEAQVDGYAEQIDALSLDPQRGKLWEHYSTIVNTCAEGNSDILTSARLAETVSLIHYSYKSDK